MGGGPLLPGIRSAPLLLALAYWRRRFNRALLMLLGVAAGTALLGGVLLVNDALMRTYDGWARGVLGFSELEVRAVTNHGFSPAWAERIRDVPGVGAVAPILEHRSYLFRGDARLGVNVRGVDPAAEGELRPLSIVAGRALEPADRHVTLLSHPAAVALDAAPGSDVELLTPEGLQVLRVVGVFHPLGAEGAAQERAALVTVAEAQALFEQGRAVITRVDLATAGGAPEAVEAQLKEIVGGAAVVVRSRQAAGELAAASSGMRTMLLLAGLLAVVAAAVLIAVNVRAMLDERSADLAVLHRLGVARRRLRRWLALEVAAVVLLGALPALPLAAPTARVILTNLPQGLLPFAASAAAPRLGPSFFSTPVAVWLLVALLAVLLGRSLVGWLLGRVAREVLGGERAAAWARLAGNLMERRLPQSATVSVALALTLAGMIGIQGVADSSRRSLAAWLDGAVTWDLRVAAGPPAAAGSVTLPQATMAQVAALPGVASVAAERQVTAHSRGRGLTVIALGGTGAEYGNRLRTIQAADLSGSSVMVDLQEGRGVALSVPLAARLSLSVGDRLPLSTHAGEAEYTVVALVADSASRAEAAYIGLDSYRTAWSDHSVDSLTVRLTAGTEAAALASAMTTEEGAAGAKVPLHVTLADAYRTELLNGAGATFGAARLVALIAVLVALLALLGSGLAAAWQAAPELVELRALGVPRRLLARVLALNLAVTGGVGAVAGAVLGTLLSLQLSRLLQGAAAPTAWHWPTGAYAAVAALLALTAALAAWLLAPRAGLALPRGFRR